VTDNIHNLAWILLMLGLTLMPFQALSGGLDGSDVLRGVAYRLDPAPNYEGLQDRDGRGLTDGVKGEGRIWTNGQAVGWTWKTPVTATFNLGRRAAVAHVRVYTASGTNVGIYLPSQILVFGGDDSGRFEFLGASALALDGENSEFASTGQVDIRFPAREVSQLSVVVFARGAFTLLSEVEAFDAGPAGGGVLAGDLVDLEAVKVFAGNFRRAAIAELPGPAPVGPDMTRRWAMPEGAVRPAGADVGCTTLRIDPWAGQGAAAQREPARTSFDLPLVALVQGHDYAAWRISNKSSGDAAVRLNISAPTAVSTRGFALAYVQALNYDWVPDVAMPFQDTTLPANSSMTVLVEASPVSEGNHKIGVSIRCGGAVNSFSVALTAIATDSAVKPLHGNVWSYLQEPVTSALACQPDFLADYGIDSADVHPAALLEVGDKRPTNLLRRYFRAYRDIPRIMLYMDIKTRPWAFLNMNEKEGAAALREWWDWVQSVAKEEGVRGELMLFPIDEPGFADIPRLYSVRRLMDRAGIKARLYVTVDKNYLVALVPADIIQLLHPTEEAVEMLKLREYLELDSYDIRQDGKLRSPHGYYRMQGWQAFAYGLAGIGVWALWDSTGSDDPATGWNPFSGRERDFGLIYKTANGCAAPSLRLLAWRRGMEENRLLRQCTAHLPHGAAALRQSIVPGMTSAEAGSTIVRIAAACN
jgi:hypothetical protein